MKEYRGYKYCDTLNDIDERRELFFEVSGSDTTICILDPSDMWITTPITYAQILQGSLNNGLYIEDYIQILFEGYINTLIPDQPKCPICNYLIRDCQCRYGGSAHPDRSKRRSVVLDHLYLFNKEQIDHIIELEKHWLISYIDDEKNKILENLKIERSGLFKND